jgi:hypothetical protein
MRSSATQRRRSVTSLEASSLWYWSGGYRCTLAGAFLCAHALRWCGYQPQGSPSRRELIGDPPTTFVLVVNIASGLQLAGPCRAVLCRWVGDWAANGVQWLLWRGALVAECLAGRPSRGLGYSLIRDPCRILALPSPTRPSPSGSPAPRPGCDRRRRACRAPGSHGS